MNEYMAFIASIILLSSAALSVLSVVVDDYITVELPRLSTCFGNTSTGFVLMDNETGRFIRVVGVIHSNATFYIGINDLILRTERIGSGYYKVDEIIPPEFLKKSNTVWLRVDDGCAEAALSAKLSMFEYGGVPTSRKLIISALVAAVGAMFIFGKEVIGEWI